MKKILLIIGLALGLARIALANSYGEGWQAGWEAGWKHKHGELSIVPICPVAPFPRFDHDTYDDGFLDGAMAAEAYLFHPPRQESKSNPPEEQN
jgi:hypothetical protein